MDENLENKNIQNKSNNNINYPNLIFSSILVENSHSEYCTDNSFIIIDSIDKILYLIYSTRSKSIISFDLVNNKQINEIKNAHKEFISMFVSYSDNNNKRDLIMSISPKNRNIKLWNIKNWECLYNFIDLYKDGYLRTSCFLKYNYNLYIVTSHFSPETHESIKIFDFKGNLIKEIEDSKANTYFIDSYFDEKISKLFIITSNENYCRSYDFNKNHPYKKYSDNIISENKIYHLSFVINKKDGIVQLIESSYDGNIRVWNFHSGILLKKIKLNNSFLDGICLWDNELLFVGSSDKNVILIELISGKIIEKYSGHDSSVITVKKISHPKLGKCLLSQGYENANIIIWKDKK